MHRREVSPTLVHPNFGHRIKLVRWGGGVPSRLRTSLPRTPRESASRAGVIVSIRFFNRSVSVTGNSLAPAIEAWMSSVLEVAKSEGAVVSCFFVISPVDECLRELAVSGMTEFALGHAFLFGVSWSLNPP